MSVSSPLNLKAWIDEHRHLLKPPVGNQCVWMDRDFIVMIVGGPNARKDYHVNQTEEFYYQLEGDITVRIIDNGTPRDVSIKQGEIFLLPPGVPHSPQRPAGTVGMVIERQRPAGMKDHLRFYCDKCQAVVYEPEFDMQDIVNQLKKIMEEFWADGNEARRTCKKCNTTMAKPLPAK